MRCRGVSYLAVIIVFLLITWGISMNFFDSQESTRNILGLNHVDRIRFKTATSAPQPKCSLSKVCPPDHFSLHIKSGAANVVGPKICFEGTQPYWYLNSIMSHVLNNVGAGLNIVVVNGENGVVEKFGYLNMQAGNPEDILAYLKEIKPGMIVLVASFDDVTTKMTKEIREIFVGMGSTLIKSVKRRDSWVFAGRTGTGNKSIYEKQAVNDQKNNIYEGWPAMVEMGACFPRTLTDEH